MKNSVKYSDDESLCNLELEDNDTLRSLKDHIKFDEYKDLTSNHLNL